MVVKCELIEFILILVVAVLIVLTVGATMQEAGIFFVPPIVVEHNASEDNKLSRCFEHFWQVPPLP